jgi:hypothetical protein
VSAPGPVHERHPSAMPYGRRMGRRRWAVVVVVGVVVAVTVAVLVVSRGGGGDDDPVATATTGEPSGGDALGPTEPTGDPAGEYRCQRVGYTCTWVDVEEVQFARVADVAAEVQRLVDEAPSAVAGIEAAVGYLVGLDDVVEIIPDEVTATSVMWRLQGTPPSVVLTELAGPLGEGAVYAGPPLGPVDGGGEAAGASSESPRAVTVGYRPTGGPLEPKQAFVLDAYAVKATDCDGLDDADCYKADDGSRQEGAIIAAIMASSPQIRVTYQTGSDVNPFAFPDLSGYELVHVASHGSNACGGVDWFENADFDPDKCYTVLGLSKATPEQMNDQMNQALESGVGVNLPAGVWYSGGGWAITTEFLAGRLNSDAIVYMSHCTSGDGQLARQSFGGFVGWHSYARKSVAQQAAIRFWELMVVEGVEFDLAIEVLGEEGLDSTTVAGAQFALPPVAFVDARLVSGGKNLRARDVIKTFVGEELTAGATVVTEGLLEDGQFNTVPEVRFDVEGVTEGKEGSSSITVLIDGEEVQREIKVSEGQISETGMGWNDWTVVVEDLPLPRDVTRVDVDFASPAPHRWETRVSDGQGHSAHEAEPVYFSSDVEAAGPLPIFTELERQMAAIGATVEGNELVLSFNTAGGAMTGEMFVTLEATGGAGYWEYSLTGTYDPATGAMGGEGSGVAQGFAAGIGAGDTDSGTWEATADLDAGVVRGSIAFSDGVQQFEGSAPLRPSPVRREEDAPGAFIAERPTVPAVGRALLDVAIGAVHLDEAVPLVEAPCAAVGGEGPQIEPTRGPCFARSRSAAPISRPVQCGWT